MKKQCIAAVATSVLTGVSLAANVQLYGVIDTGLSYSKTTFNDAINQGDMVYEGGWVDSKSTLQMVSGQHNGTRVGLKGEESLGNGLTVSFMLENGFDSDTGALGQQGQLFGREARLTLAHACGGEISFGRMGTLSSNTGTYGLFWNYADALGGGWGGSVGALNTGYAQVGARFDNSIVIKTPTMAGLTGFAMYSLGNGTEKAQSSQNDRYAALGAIYDNGPLGIAAVAETYKTPPASFSVGPFDFKMHRRDSYNINLGASYDFDAVKVFASYQYARFAYASSAVDAFSQRFVYLGGSSGVLAFADGLKGHTASLSASMPLAGGTSYAGYSFGTHDLESPDSLSSASYKSNNLYLAYDYDLSSRTTIYAGAAYTDYKMAIPGSVTLKARILEAQAGLVHRF